MLFQITNFLHRTSTQLKKRLLFYAYKGVKNEPDENKQSYIIYLNLIAIITFTINIITAVIFFFIQEFLAGFGFLLSSPFFLIWPFYFNRNGLRLSSRILWVIYADLLLIVSASVFSHDSSLDKYYLCIAINCNFMYTQKEKKWLIFSLFFTIAFFVIESTPLQNFLPAFNLINNLSRGDKIVLFGLTLTIILDVLVAVYINSLRERYLLERQKLLEEAQKRVQVQNDDLKTFSIAASHSMQTPLHVSTFFLQKIKENNFPTTTDAEYKKYLLLIENGLTQMEQLVSGLFSYNRIINLENEISVFDMSKEINGIQKSVTPRYPDSTVIVGSTTQKVLLNKMLFSIVIQNLIDNGLKYNRSARPAVEVEFHTTNKWIDILVKDNGIGIPPIFFNSIFEPFKRIQQDPGLAMGNGLGLAGAKRAAERMGGSLICLKSSRVGTVFKLSIPNNKT